MFHNILNLLCYMQVLTLYKLFQQQTPYQLLLLDLLRQVWWLHLQLTLSQVCIFLIRFIYLLYINVAPPPLPLSGLYSSHQVLVTYLLFTNVNITIYEIYM